MFGWAAPLKKYVNESVKLQVARRAKGLLKDPPTL